jgi:hypothetical protein
VSPISAPNATRMSLPQEAFIFRRSALDGSRGIRMPHAFFRFLVVPMLRITHGLALELLCNINLKPICKKATTRMAPHGQANRVTWRIRLLHAQEDHVRKSVDGTFSSTQAVL